MNQELRFSIQQKLHQEIPLSKPEHLDFQILELNEKQTRSRIPLKGNTNHLGTLFGGSLYCAGALSCYSTLLGILKRAGFETNNIVVIDSQIQYRSPGLGDTEYLVEVDPAEVDRIAESLRAKGRARAQFKAQAYCHSQLVLELSASYKITL